MQIESTKLIFVMNFSVLHFFKFASRMPQIAQIFVLTFKIFRGRGEGVGGGGGGMPSDPPPLEISPFFSSAIPGSECRLMLPLKNKEAEGSF